MTRRVSGLDTLRERGLITVKTLRVAFSLYFFIGSHCNKIPSASPPRTIFPLLYLLSSIRSIHQHSCSPCSLSSMHRARLASTGHGGQPQSQLARMTRHSRPPRCQKQFKSCVMRRLFSCVHISCSRPVFQPFGSPTPPPYARQSLLYVQQLLQSGDKHNLYAGISSDVCIMDHSADSIAANTPRASGPWRRSTVVSPLI